MKNTIIIFLIVLSGLSTMAQNNLSLNSVSGHPGDTVTMTLSMTNSDSPVAVQAMIPLGDQLNYVNGSCMLNPARSNGHQLTAVVVNDTLRIYSYSFSLQPYQGTDGALLSFKVVLGQEPATYEMSLSNIRLSSTAGVAFQVTSTSGSVTILAPKISVNPNTFDFGHCPIRNTYSSGVTISNIGNEPLIVGGMTFDDSTLSVSPASATISAGASSYFTIQYSPMVAGNVTMHAVVNSNACVGDSVALVSADPYSVNELWTQSAEGNSDSVVRIYMSVNNMDSIVGLQAKLKLPEGFSYIPNSFRVEQARCQGHQANAGISGDTLSLVIFNSSNLPFIGTDGEVCSFEVRLSGYGWYSLCPFDVVLADASAHNVLSNAWCGSVHVFGPVLSASPTLDMGITSVEDTAMTEYPIFNEGNAPLTINNIVFTQSGYSVIEELPLTIGNYGNATLHVVYTGTNEGNYSALMKIYSNDPAHPLYDVTVQGRKYEPNAFALVSNSELDDSLIVIDVEMDNYSEITAIQFDIQYPHHFFSLNSTDFQTTSRSANHVVSAARQSDSVFRVIMFSLNNSPIQGHSGSALSLNMHPLGTVPQTVYHVVASKIVLGDLQGNNKLSHADSICIIGGLPVVVNVHSQNDTMGSVSISGHQFIDHTIQISANANYGYHFIQWNDGDTANPRIVLLTIDTSFTAYFAANQYLVDAVSQDTTKGTVLGGGMYDYLSTAQITAVPSYGYMFSQWSDSSTENPKTIVVTGDTNFTAEFTEVSFTITAMSSNDAMGIVTLQGSYLYGTAHTLTVTANYGYHFVQWNDGDTANPRAFILTGDTSFTAYFAANQYLVDAVSQDTTKGTVLGGRMYDYLSTAQITAVPSYGYMFSQWSDGSIENPKTIVVTGDTNISAQFTEASISITAMSSDNAMGIVTVQGSYLYGTTHTLTATANYGYHFVQWNDGDTANPRVFVLTGDTSFTAYFAANQYLVDAVSQDTTKGTVLGGGMHDYLSTAQITAVPSYGYMFSQWSDGSTENPRTFVVTGDTSFTAEFSETSFSITAMSSNDTMGTVTVQGSYLYGTVHSLTATANYGYHFVQWDDGDTVNPRVFVLTGDTSFTAYFAANQYLVDAVSQDTTKGTVLGGGMYDYLSTAQITAVPSYGYMFSQWSDGSTENPRTIVVTGDTSFTAQFTEASFSITAMSSDDVMGTVTVQGSYLYGTAHTLTATANYGYHFVQWNDGDTTNPRVFILTGDTSFSAYFAANQYTINVASSDSTMGTVSGSGSYPYNSVVEIVATANAHCHFLNWSDGITDNPRSIVVGSDSAFVAVFSVDTYTVTLSVNDMTMGSVTGAGEYAYGEEATIEANANEGYNFVRWSNGDTNAVMTFVVIEDVFLEAIFEIETGIDEVEFGGIKVRTGQMNIYVSGGDGQELRIFDLNGRMLVEEKQVSNKPHTMPTAGVYFVKVGKYPVQKVVVTR